MTTTVDISNSFPLCMIGSNGGTPSRPQTCIGEPLTANTFRVAMHVYPLVDTDVDGEVNGYGSQFSHIGGPTLGMYVMVP